MPGADYDRDAPRYARRPVEGTDGLVFRALEQRIRSLALSGTGLDVGCGTGRSTRFLHRLGFSTVGLDVSEAMVLQARRIDPDGEYRTCDPGAAFPFPNGRFDVLLSTWVVVELNTLADLQHLLSESARVLRAGGRGFVATNTPEFYSHNWVSCDIDFPENRGRLQSGQAVKARLLPEELVVHDTFWSDPDYRAAFAAAGLHVSTVHLPRAPSDEEGWCDETRVAPYIIYEVEHVA